MKCKWTPHPLLKTPFPLHGVFIVIFLSISVRVLWVLFELVIPPIFLIIKIFHVSSLHPYERQDSPFPKILLILFCCPDLYLGKLVLGRRLHFSSGGGKDCLVCDCCWCNRLPSGRVHVRPPRAHHVRKWAPCGLKVWMYKCENAKIQV